ncbi:MAG TPA: hypothetical protein VM582_00105 [Candidatus Thermoplasmatota archaeon]|nr:hypothetical protein [Candidatus Thermoplasmatota archaeon]
MDARSLFPLTVAYLGGAAPAARTPAEFVRAVCEAHARGDIPSRAARDLAQYEALLQELRPARVADPGPLPRDDEAVVLAPSVRVLVYGADLPGMLAALREGKAPTPRPARGWIVAWRDAGGELREHLLLREEGWILERFRQPATPGDALEDEEREDFAALWKLGVLRQA